MTKMDQISSRFRRSKKATQPPAVAPSSDLLPSPDGTKLAAPSLKQPPQQHESPPALTIATTTPPSSSHSTQSNLSNISDHNSHSFHTGIRNTLHPPKSPFRGFHHFRSSNKRARSPAPASLAVPTSPAVVNHDGIVEHEMISPSKDPSEKEDEAAAVAAATINKPKIPAFLALSESEIDSRFQEITWQERTRLLQAAQHPSPNHQYARILTPEVKALDRYANIQPWANNRVKLQVPEGALDYINASPIVLRSPLAQPPEKRPPLRYIAMQGPKFGTIDHVWRMVAEQLRSPAVIVMLTETHEMGMEKCYPYFPRTPDDEPLRIGDDDEFGDGFRATLRCAEVEERADGAIEMRKLVLDIMELDVDVDVEDCREGEGEGEEEESKSKENIKSSITVWHLLYRRWPDFGVPALEDIDSFFELMRLSRELNAGGGGSDNPRIIHCSAGVGRSGTFMALEHLMREVESGDLEKNYEEQQQQRDDYGENAGEFQQQDQDLVYNTVNALREQRRQMVQAEPQYLFIYTVLRKLWMDKYGITDDRAGRMSEEPAAKRLEVDHDPFVED